MRWRLRARCWSPSSGWCTKWSVPGCIPRVLLSSEAPRAGTWQGRELGQVAGGDRVALDPVALGPALAGQMVGAEEPVDHGQVDREALVDRLGLRGVMPVVELRRGEPVRIAQTQDCAEAEGSERDGERAADLALPEAELGLRGLGRQ